MKRRSLLAAMLAATTAPAIVRAGSLMRIDPRIIVPPTWAPHAPYPIVVRGVLLVRGHDGTWQPRGRVSDFKIAGVPR